MQYSKHSNSEGITRDETSSAESVCADQLSDTYGQTNVTFYLKVAVITIPCIATVITTIITHVCYQKIERKLMTFPKPDFYALVFVGITVTVFIFTVDIISYVKVERKEYSFDNSFSLLLTFIVLISEATVGSILIICLFILIFQWLFQCCHCCQCCKVQWNRFYFQLLITFLSFVSFHTGYIFAAWVTEPSKTTSVAVLSLAIMAFIFIMFRFLHIFFEYLIEKCWKLCEKYCTCCKEKKNYKKVMTATTILVCTSVVAAIGVGLICVVLASFYILPLQTIGLVEHLQNIVNVCIVLLAALVTYKLIGANESDTEKFLRILNKSYQERKMMFNFTKAEALNNYDTIFANFKICLQLNKIKLTEHGNKKRAIIECDSGNCIIYDPQNDFDVDVPIDSAKLYTDSFFANEDTFETDFTKCVLEVRVVAAKGAQLCRFPVPSDSTLKFPVPSDLNMHSNAPASGCTLCLKELYKTPCSQNIDTSQIRINNIMLRNENKSCQLSSTISIPRILSSDHLLRSCVWCPLDGSVIAIMKESGEITRELIPKILSFQISNKAIVKGFSIEQGKLFISSSLRKLKISSLGSKVRINFLIPCGKCLCISEGSPGDTILLKPQSETQSAANQDATITLPMNVVSSCITALFLKITNNSSTGHEKEIEVKIKATQGNHETSILSTATNDKMIIAFKSDRSMSLSGLFSSSSPVSLINKEVKLEMKSVNAVLHFSRDINVAEIEKDENDQLWKLSFDNVIVSDLKDEGFEMFSLTTMEESSSFLGFPSYECDIIGDDIEAAATICGNLLSKV